MSATVAEATGNPEGLKRPPQQVRPDQTHTGKYPAHREILSERRVKAEYREDKDLRDDRNAVADDHVSD